MITSIWRSSSGIREGPAGGLPFCADAAEPFFRREGGRVILALNEDRSACQTGLVGTEGQDGFGAKRSRPCCISLSRSCRRPGGTIEGCGDRTSSELATRGARLDLSLRNGPAEYRPSFRHPARTLGGRARMRDERKVGQARRRCPSRRSGWLPGGQAQPTPHPSADLTAANLCRRFPQQLRWRSRTLQASSRGESP